MATRPPRRPPIPAALALLALALPAASPLPAAGTLFLERCAGGCTYIPGFDNSCLNRTSVASSTSNLSAFEHGDAAWQQLVACVESALDPYDVTITEIDPGCGTPHWEVAIAGTPGQLGMGSGVGGVSPFSCGVIFNAPAFAFANVYSDMLDLCWTVVHEFAHLLGADHELLQRDPMTYLAGCLVKRFADAPADCGEDAPRDCCTGSSTQSSDAIVRNALGQRPGGLIFPDAFEAWDPAGQTFAGSTCHWDQVVGALELPEGTAHGPGGFACATATGP